MMLKRWERKELVQSLRRKGFSYKEIRQRLTFPIAKSTVSNWCKDIPLTPKQLDRLDKLFQIGSYRNRLLGSKATQLRRAKEIEEIKGKARSEVSQLRHSELWLAGLMLYWAEGTKKRDIKLTNSDPNMIRFMMRWFHEVVS